MGWKEASELWLAMPPSERIFRRLLAFAHCEDGLLYGDDGELHCGICPAIDYLRDSAEEIDRKIGERNMQKLVRAGLAQEASR